MSKKQYNFRLDPSLMGWVNEHYADFGAASKTDLIENLLMALREGRLMVRPRSGPNAFPANEVEAGSVPEYPILIAGLPE